jgi:hypothetical protein
MRSMQTAYYKVENSAQALSCLSTYQQIKYVLMIFINFYFI